MDYKNVDEVLNTFADTTIANARKNLVDDRKSFGALYQNLFYVTRNKLGCLLLNF